VVTDDLSAQKGERVSQPIETKGCEPVYLPPYSPDFDPIEQAFYLWVAPHVTLV
jgi:transposase